MQGILCWPNPETYDFFSVQFFFLYLLRVRVRDAICLGRASALTPSLFLFVCGRVLVLPVLHHLQKLMPAKFTLWSWLKKMGHLDSA